MQSLYTQDIHSGWEQRFSAEPFLCSGVPPGDEASFVLVEEALRNAIRELESIELVIGAQNSELENVMVKCFLGKLSSASQHHENKENQIRSEILQIFASAEKQRALIEQRTKLREALRPQSTPHPPN